MRYNTADINFMFWFHYLAASFFFLLASFAARFAAAYDPSGSLSFVILYTMKHRIALTINRYTDNVPAIP